MINYNFSFTLHDATAVFKKFLFFYLEHETDAIFSRLCTTCFLDNDVINPVPDLKEARYIYWSKGLGTYNYISM